MKGMPSASESFLFISLKKVFSVFTTVSESSSQFNISSLPNQKLIKLSNSFNDGIYQSLPRFLHQLKTGKNFIELWSSAYFKTAVVFSLPSSVLAKYGNFLACLPLQHHGSSTPRKALTYIAFPCLPLSSM